MPLMPRIQLQSLNPLRVMGRNDRCWCGSGDKWKSCHRSRESEERPHYLGVVKPAMAKLFAKGECGHPDAPGTCSGEAINSHTLQKGGALAAIAENGHVISCRQATDRLHQNKGALVPQKTGVKSASTFPGFCNAHDTEFFLPIERGELPLTRDTAFLLIYRAMAYERHTKKAAVEGLIEARRFADAGRTFEAQADIQNTLHPMLVGMEMGKADLDRWKVKLDAMHRSGDTREVGLMAVSFGEVLPFVAAFSKLPTYDFLGLKRQSLASQSVSALALTVTVAAGRTVAVFAWTDGDESAGAKTALSFADIPQEDRATALVRYCLSSSENVHMRPSWWDGLSKVEREDAAALLHMGLPLSDNARPDHHLVGKGPLKLPAVASEILRL